jgi:hypothetical protein
MSIIQEIRDEIKEVYREPTSRDLNILALVFLLFPSVIGLVWLYWKGLQSGWYFIAAGVVLALCRAVPPLFRLIYRTWIGFSVILGYFVSRILLTIIFFVVIIPTGFLMRLLGKDPMDRKLDPDAKTYWIKREEGPPDPESYERQF